jgi:hypothetical protein
VDDRRAAQQAHQANVRAPMLGDPAVRCDDGVADVQSAEVDDCGQPAVADQLVQRGEAGVDDVRLVRGVAAVEPLLHAPGKGKPLPGSARGKRDRHGQQQERASRGSQSCSLVT